MMKIMLLRLMIMTAFAVATFDLLPSKVISRPGHYPHIWCQLSNVVLSARSSAFLYVRNPESEVDLNTECDEVTNIWPIRAMSNETEDIACDEEYEEGHAFTLFYFHGTSNYFHLHKDTIMPMYQILHYNQDSPPETVVLMPTVETQRLKKLDWDTDAFEEPSKYWMKIMRPLMTDNTIFLPLKRSLLNSSSNICFKNIYFGTPHVNQNDAFIQGYVKFMKTQLYVLERPLTIDGLRVGLISRSNRRRIINEQELVDVMQPIVGVDLIRFESLGVREQISLVQRYAVIVGVNGAGLMNALFRSQHAMAIQLVPYQAELNNAEFARMLSAVGPYMEWQNTHRHLHQRTGLGDDTRYNSQADTIVNVTEFKQLIQTALGSVKDLIMGIKEEL